MHRIMFVCHGNICRSPMAEFVMRDLVMRAGRANEFRIDSCATTTEEIGHGIYAGAKMTLASHGVSCVGHVAKQVRREDYGAWDLFVAMDDENVRDLSRIFRRDPDHKVRKMLEFATPASTRDVADPWYTGDFEATWSDVYAGCTGLLASL